MAEAVGRFGSIMEARPFRAMWTCGELLDPDAGSVDVARVVIVVDLPPEEVTWMALPLAVVGFADAAGLEKLPVSRVWHPRGLAGVEPRHPSSGEDLG